MQLESLCEREKITRKTADIHFLQVLGLQDDDGQFAGRGYVAQGEADVAQLVFLRK